MTQYLYTKASLLAVSSLIVTAAMVALPTWAQEGTTATNVNVSQNTVVIVPTPQPNEPADAVVFYITDDRQTVAPGEILTYRVVVRNQRNADINEVRITAHIPDYLIPTATSPEAEANAAARTLTWNNLNLGARAEQTYAIRAQIAPDTPVGYVVRTVAEINGPGVRGSFTDTSGVENKGFQVSGQAATTTAPAAPIVLPQPTSIPPYPPAVAPTAKTGASTNILIGMTILGSVGLLFQSRKAHSFDIT